MIDEVARRAIVKACSAGATIAEAAKHVGVSESTVDRVLRSHVRASGENVVKRGRPTRTHLPFALTKRRRSTSIEIPPEDINRIYNALRKGGFPYPQHLSTETFATSVDKLRSLAMFAEGGEVIRPQSYQGVKVCAPFFPHRYDAVWRNAVSAREAWDDPVLLRKAIEFQIRYNAPLRPANVLRAVTLNCRTPTIFRPAVAKYIYRNFCPKGGLVWDPCSGYGGRILGAFVAGVRYVGTDVDVQTVDGNCALAKRLGANSEVFAVPAETFDPPKVDLVFTSPPYFNRERYSKNNNQTWKKYGANIDAWIEGFLRPVIKSAHRALDRERFLVINIADLREDGVIIPLVSRTIQVAIESGFDHVKTLQMPLGAVNRNKPTEPVLIFQK